MGIVTSAEGPCTCLEGGSFGVEAPFKTIPAGKGMDGHHAVACVIAARVVAVAV